MQPAGPWRCRVLTLVVNNQKMLESRWLCLAWCGWKSLSRTAGCPEQLGQVYTNKTRICCSGESWFLFLTHNHSLDKRNTRGQASDFALWTLNSQHKWSGWVCRMWYSDYQERFYMYQESQISCRHVSSFAANPCFHDTTGILRYTDAVGPLISKLQCDLLRKGQSQQHKTIPIWRWMLVSDRHLLRF